MNGTSKIKTIKYFFNSSDLLTNSLLKKIQKNVIKNKISTDLDAINKRLYKEINERKK